jgi:RNA polymerase sigma factor (sigma-70 family)
MAGNLAAQPGTQNPAFRRGRRCFSLLRGGLGGNEALPTPMSQIRHFMSINEAEKDRAMGPDAFLTTRWSCVLRAGEMEGQAAAKALEELCRNYWKPLYFYSRRVGFGPEDAQDLTQGFFLNLIEKQSFTQADRERGRFRTFLLSAFSHFIANHRRHHATQKRGGGREFIAMDVAVLEASLAGPGQEAVTPEVQFERSWAFTLLENVMGRLRGEYVQANRLELFEALEPALAPAQGRLGYAAMGARLGLSESAVAVSVHRMRKRYGQLLREGIAATVDSEEEVEAELRHLIRIVAGGGGP